MISLKRNTKKELVEAKGIRIRKSSVYQPNQQDDFKISRSKFDDFLKCQRCFYLDRVKGLESPQIPQFKLNEATDFLYKKEFDACRENQRSHRIFQNEGLAHIIPFKHNDLEKWRDSIHHGLKIRFKDTNIILSGGIDDVMQNTKNKKLIVVDYKSQAKKKEDLNTTAYLKDVYHEGYKTQLDFYAFLFTEMNFDLDPIGYFIVCNGSKDSKTFNCNMKFDELLVPYKWNFDWIPNKIDEMINLINSESLPKPNPSCMNCAYSLQRHKIEK